jgi:hypothetical protein
LHSGLRSERSWRVCCSLAWQASSCRTEPMNVALSYDCDY